MSSKYTDGPGLEPLGETGSRFYVAAAIFALLGAISVAIWLLEVTGGHIANLGNWGTEGAVPWGLDIGAFVVWAGVGVGALVVSAAIRLLRLDKYAGFARVGEFLVLPAFLAGFLHILYDMGRPGRVLNTVLHPQFGSPLFWDIVLLGGLGILGLLYLLVAGRADANANGLEQGTVRGLAALLLVYVPLFGAGLVPWLLASGGSNVSWFGAVQGPMFLLLGISSALATLLIVGGVLRIIGGWEEQFSERSLVVIGGATAGTSTLYLAGTAFTVQSGGFAPIGAALNVGSEILASGYGTAMYLLLIVGLLVSGVLASQAVFGWSSDGVAVVSGVLLMIAFVGFETTLIVGGLAFPEMMYPDGMYTPSMGEIVRTIGVAGIVGLGLLVLAKWLPIKGPNAETTQ